MVEADRKVLVIDPDSEWRERAVAAFGGAGHEVVTAQDASEALRKAGETRLALIIMELNLGGESGLMLMKFLKRNHPDVPIIIATSLAHDDQTVEEIMKQGAEHYLSKDSMDALIVAAGAYLQ